MTWLLPSVCMAAVTMALASWLPVRTVATAVGAVWVTAAASSARGAASAALTDRFVAFRPAGQVALAVASAAAGVMLLARREHFEIGQDMGGLT
jgi:hypothetical protein